MTHDLAVKDPGKRSQQALAGWPPAAVARLDLRFAANDGAKARFVRLLAADPAAPAAK